MRAESQREAFDRRAARYDAWLLRTRWPRNQEWKAAWIAASLGEPAADDVVVEIGCGTGQIAELLLDRHLGCRYIGVDISARMLDVADRRLARFGGRADLRPAQAERLPLAEGEAAAGFGIDVLHHVADRVASLRELRRVLVPGGKIAFLEGNPKFPLNALIALKPEERGMWLDTGRNFRAWLAGAGFEDGDVDYAPLFTPPGPRALGRAYDRVDRVLSRVPGVRALAIFYALSARSPTTSRLR